ncbi:PAQR family membrane homeostasis protein TrhA [Falsirhodobacter algicola]|uniref:Hly-III family protein n=1 Tax=Falsirhodobacter algicola TaxID=2692330 RepID=A0A8J8MT48_9RHOB|nr:hemolysin III family protein [Falsirhodobacter algicola]QUS35992.1 Hly-III family protein [Falsirhodobacter algicola]
MAITTKRTVYSRSEWISDAAVHVLGTVLALAAVPVLVTLTAVLRPDLSALAGIGIYGATLIAMLLCSALYNMLHAPGWRGVLQRLDHSAIYLKIAGTYTAFVLLSGATEVPLVILLWTAALTGVTLKVAAPDRFRWAGFGLYIGMGWAGLLAGWPLFATMTAPVLALIVAGGVIYTLGTLFYLRDGMPYHRTIWHVCVLAASGVFFAAVTVHMVAGSHGIG